MKATVNINPPPLIILTHLTFSLGLCARIYSSATLLGDLLIYGIEDTPLLNALKYGKGILCKWRDYISCI